MKTHALFIFFILLVFKIFASAEEISIVDVRRNITLADEDPIYKDFYLNAGEGAGLKKNLVVLVKRKILVKDHGTKSVGDFETVVGQMRIIHVEGHVAVGREYKFQNRDELPMLEQMGMMTGDRIDLSGAFTDNSKTMVKRKVATQPASEEPKLHVETETSAPTDTKTAALQIDVIDTAKSTSPAETPTESKREPATPKTLSPQPIPEI